MNKFSLRYDDVETNTQISHPAAKSALAPTNKQVNKSLYGDSKTVAVPNPPPLLNTQLFSSNPLAPSAFLMSAAAAGMLCFIPGTCSGTQWSYLLIYLL